MIDFKNKIYKAVCFVSSRNVFKFPLHVPDIALFFVHIFLLSKTRKPEKQPQQSML